MPQIFNSGYLAHFFAERDEILQRYGSGQSTLVPWISWTFVRGSRDIVGRHASVLHFLFLCTLSATTPSCPPLKTAGALNSALCALISSSIVFLPNVAICCRPSVCRVSVCLSSVVCNVRAPYSAGSNFQQFFYVVGTLAIQWHPLKILWGSSPGNPSVGGV